jgi:hypothetical protein
VLADLERREVEAERRELPSKIGNLSPRDPGHPVDLERVLDLAQLDIERVGTVVCGGAGTGLAGQDGARPP